MPYFYILVFFFSQHTALQSFFKHLFYVSARLSPLGAESFSQHHPRKNEDDSRSPGSVFLIRNKPRAPFQHANAWVRSTFIHMHTQAPCTHCETNGGNSSPSIPFHGEFFWLWRRYLFLLVSTSCAVLYFLFFCPYCGFECMCACWAYLLTSHSLNAHMYTQLLLL